MFDHVKDDTHVRGYSCNDINVIFYNPIKWFDDCLINFRTLYDHLFAWQLQCFAIICNLSICIPVGTFFFFYRTSMFYTLSR